MKEFFTSKLSTDVGVEKKQFKVSFKGLFVVNAGMCQMESKGLNELIPLSTVSKTGELVKNNSVVAQDKSVLVPVLIICAS